VSAVPEGYVELDWARGFAAAIGPIYQRAADGWYTRAMRIDDRHTNGMMNAHGGVLMSFADMAFGHAVSFQNSMWWVTVRLTCDFLAAAEVGDWLEGSAQIIGRDGDLFTVRGRVWTGDRIVITGGGVFKALKPRPPRPGELAYQGAG
jgi:uncharacterized protein (TIGR00369 family)